MNSKKSNCKKNNKKCNSNNRKFRSYVNNKRRRVASNTYKRGLTVGCINIRGIVSDIQKRIDLNAWLGAQNLEILCLQEWYVSHKLQKENDNDNNEEFEEWDCYDYDITIDMAQLNGYEKIEKFGNTKTAILYRSDVDVISLDHIDNISQNGLDTSWIAVQAERSIVVIGSIYYSPSYNCQYDEVAGQIAQIRNELKTTSKPIIFMINGDFNAKNELWGSTETDQRGQILSDWMGSYGFTYLNTGEYTHISRNGTDVLDLTIIDSNHRNIVKSWSVQKLPARVNKYNKYVKFSDHRCMITQFNFDPKIKEQPSKIAWNLDEKKVEEFNNKLLPLMEDWKVEYDMHWKDESMVDSLVEYFQLIIVSTAKEVFGFKKYNNQSINWADKRIHKWLIEKKKVANSISHLIGDVKRRYGGLFYAPKSIKRKYKKKKHKLNKLNKKLKKRKYLNIIESTKKVEKLINDPNVNNDKLFYDTLKKISHRASKKIPLIKDMKTDKVIATTDEKIAEKIHEYYIRPLQRNPPLPELTKFHNYVDDYIQNYKTNKNKNDTIVNRAYTQQEVAHVLNTINIQSAMAFDLIHYQLLYWARTIIVVNLTLLFNLCFFIHQKCPKVWRFGEYIPVPKPGRPAFYCKNIRPIMILPGLARMISKLNCNRILTDCIKRKLITKGNCAFQPNHSPEDINLAMTEKIFRAFQNGHFLEWNVDDLKSAYDSVWLNGLLYRLIEDYKYDGNIIAWYLQSMRGRKTRLKYNNVITKWRISQDNLPQGLNESTILFVLLINAVDLEKFDNILYKLGFKERKQKPDITESNNEEYRNKDATFIKSFQIGLYAFADDCNLVMEPLMKQQECTKLIQYNFRRNLQVAIDRFYYFTSMYFLIMGKSKCCTITFTRKNNFRSYVYKMGKDKLELIHGSKNAPQKCKHNERALYTEACLDGAESNGDSDLENLDNQGNKIEKINTLATMDPNNKIFKIMKTGIHAKRQKMAIHPLVECVRVLGAHFDPELQQNPHIMKVAKIADRKLHGLLQLAHCKYFRFNAFSIFTIFKTVIRPKLEFCLCTVSGASKLDCLMKIQKRAMRIAARAKPQTPTKYLLELFSCKTIEERLEEMQVKLWHKYKRAPSNFLQKHTFNDWKQYIINNDPLSQMETGNLLINAATFNYVSKSPLSKAYAVIQKLHPTSRNLFYKQSESVMRPPPVYDVQFPNNVHVNYNNQNKIPKESGFFDHNVGFDFYTDGSCYPNPGPGGAAYYSPNFPIKSKLFAIDHDTTINYAELFAIKLVCDSVARFIDYIKQDGKYHNFSYINIYTDSQFVCSMFDKNSYPQFEYYYILLQNIFQQCHRLNEQEISINIIKINSHKGIKGNEIADKLAKDGAMLARDCKFGKSNIIKYKMHKNPVNVDIAKDLVKLRIRRKIERRQKWIDEKTENEQRFFDDDNSVYLGRSLFEKSIINHEYKVKNKTKLMLNELKYLTQYEVEIITKLRTERINLNDYLKYINKHEDGLCRFCNRRETVSHYLIECNGITDKKLLKESSWNVNYNHCRNEMKRRLKRISIFFRNPANFTANNILFPHTWQLPPKRKQKDYKIKLKKNEKRRVDILKTVVRFVIDTKRFQDAIT